METSRSDLKFHQERPIGQARLLVNHNHRVVIYLAVTKMLPSRHQKSTEYVPTLGPKMIVESFKTPNWLQFLLTQRDRQPSLRAHRKMSGEVG
jgi:hypothetical protein